MGHRCRVEIGAIPALWQDRSQRAVLPVVISIRDVVEGAAKLHSRLPRYYAPSECSAIRLFSSSNVLLDRFLCFFRMNTKSTFRMD